MILCVAPSPAWDVTYHVERFREHATNRVQTVSARAGGKAVNVARVLQALGEPVTIVAPVGGVTGQLFVAELAACGIPVEVVSIAEDLRRTVTIVSDEAGDATILNEGSVLDDWPALVARVERLVASAAVVVLSGSLPTGSPVDTFARLSRVAARHDVPVVVDTSGPALAAALAESPTLVKPNLAELPDLSDVADPRDAALQLSLASGSAVAVTLGARGMVLAVDGEVWHGSAVSGLRGNPTGAGDAALAAFARGITAGAPWPDTLHDAVALSAAAVLAPYAGEFDDAHHRELAQRVVVERVGTPA